MENTNRLIRVHNVVKVHTEKLNLMKDNLTRWEEEGWTDSDVSECENMIKILSSILSDLNNSLK